MRNSSLALLFGAAVFVLCLWSLLHDPNVTLRQAVEDVLSQGQQVMDNYTKQLEQRMSDSLQTLFDELDTNRDGTIERSEFRGAAANMMAALRTVDQARPRLPHVQLPQTRTDLISIVQSVFTMQLLFLVAIFLLVHLHAVIIRPKPQVDLAIDYLTEQPPKMEKEDTFKYATPLSKAPLYEKLKMAFFICSGLVFVRVMLVLLFFALGVFSLSMAVAGGRNRQTNPRWFGFWRTLTTFFGTMILISVGFSRIVSYGALAKDKDRKIIVANHTCVLEVVYLFIHAHMPSFVSRVENLTIPLFPAIVKASDSIMVNRDATDSRDTTLQTILARAKDPKAVPVMMFPEGTCNAGSALFQFKKGAFEAGEPVQMVCFKYPWKHFNPTWNGRRIGGNDLLDLIIRFLCQFVNHLEVVWLPVYHPTEAEKHDPALYADHVQRMMANVLMLPVSDCSYRDYSTFAKAVKENKNKRQ
jgi:lysophosphatidylcholine acyltransferase/lyso-PAF acetyltransferase